MIQKWLLALAVLAKTVTCFGKFMAVREGIFIENSIGVFALMIGRFEIESMKNCVSSCSLRLCNRVDWCAVSVVLKWGVPSVAHLFLGQYLFFCKVVSF